jgi:hypothetical protein
MEANNMGTELSELLFNALNEQGYIFQEACKYALEKNEQRIGWEVRAYEYPVSLVGQDTRVDIVLRSKTQSSPELYALVECKRADPSYIYWVFGTPHFGDALCSTLGLECRETRSDQPYQVNRLLERLHFQFVTDSAINWQEAKRGSGGRTSTSQNIENAFIQVLKGIGGFAQEHLDQRIKSRALFKTFFIPVVVTTAKLYTAYYETKNIDLSTGRISKDKVLFGPQGQPAEEDPWVLVDYGVGENVAPEPIPESYHGVDPAELQKHKIRSIFVVNAKSLVNFFSRLHLAMQEV